MRNENYICDICRVSHDDPNLFAGHIDIYDGNNSLIYYQVCKRCITKIATYIIDKLLKVNGKHNGNLRGQNN